MGWSFTEDANGAKMVNSVDGKVIRTNQQVSIISGSDSVSFTLITGSTSQRFQISDIDTIAGAPPAGTLAGVIDQLIAVFPEAPAGGGTGAVESVNNVSPDAGGNVTLVPSDIGAVPTVNMAAIVYGTNESGTQTPVAYTNGPSAFGLVMRDFSGNFTVNTPTAADQPASMGFVDSSIAAINIPTILSGSSSTLTFGEVPANSFIDLGFNITGADIGDVVALGVPGEAQIDGVAFFAMVSNTNVIDIRCVNVTTSPVTVPGGIYKATVFK